MATSGVQVVVKFPPEIPGEAQGVVLLAMEEALRQLTGLDVRVVKALQGDDSRLRVMMTPAQREKL